MAAFLITSVSSFPSSSALNASSSSRIGATPSFRLQMKSTNLLSKSFNGMRISTPLMVNSKTGVIIVKASSEIDESGSGEVVPVKKLPLESEMEQKMKMKLAKKIRLRRSRLVRKRHLRKKGRWPPSKMNKLKNV